MKRHSASGSNRMIRINDEIMRETAIIVRGELKDPRISRMTSVTKAEVTQDLKFCKIYVSILGDKDEKADVMVGLKNCAGFIRKQLASRINLRNTPEIKFVIDESLDYSIHMEQLIKEANKNNSLNEPVINVEVAGSDETIE